MGEVFARGGGEERAGAEVVSAFPTARPVGVEEDGFSAYGESGNDSGLDGTVFGRADDDARQVGKLFKGYRGEIASVGMTMERGVDVGAGVAANFVGCDLK